METNEEGRKVMQMEDEDHRMIMQTGADKLRGFLQAANGCMQILKENGYTIVLEAEYGNPDFTSGTVYDVCKLSVSRIFKQIKEEI